MNLLEFCLLGGNQGPQFFEASLVENLRKLQILWGPGLVRLAGELGIGHEVVVHCMAGTWGEERLWLFEQWVLCEQLCNGGPGICAELPDGLREQ